VDWSAFLGNAHCPLWYSMSDPSGPLGLDALAHDWPGLELYAFPTLHPLIQAMLDRTRMAEHCLLLVNPYWPRLPWFSLLSLLSGTPWQLPLRPDGRTLWRPRPHRLTIAPPMVHVRTTGGCNEHHAEHKGSRAQATTAANQLFCSWCAGIEVVPETCGVQCVLQYLQSCLDEGLAASTQRVFGRYICLTCGVDGQAGGVLSLALQVYEGCSSPASS
jgi:hypothetical protein